MDLSQNYCVMISSTVCGALWATLDTSTRFAKFVDSGRWRLKLLIWRKTKIRILSKPRLPPTFSTSLTGTIVFSASSLTSKDKVTDTGASSHTFQDINQFDFLWSSAPTSISIASADSFITARQIHHVISDPQEHDPINQVAYQPHLCWSTLWQQTRSQILQDFSICGQPQKKNFYEAHLWSVHRPAMASGEIETHISFRSYHWYQDTLLFSTNAQEPRLFSPWSCDITT